MAFLQAKLNWITVSLAASGRRTVAGLKAAAQQAVKVLEFRATHDGNTSGNAPDITILERNTFTANSPATNSFSYPLVKKDPGRGETPQTTAATQWTTEPQATTLQEVYNLPQYNGAYHYIFPFAAPEIVVGGNGYSVDHNSPQTVNSCGKFDVEE
jgi:hypothetical protein